MLQESRLTVTLGIKVCAALAALSIPALSQSDASDMAPLTPYHVI